jgi:hypothetical protein
MIFQQILKGIPARGEGQGRGLSDEGVQEILNGGGIYSNWWLNAPGGTISPPEIAAKLTEKALVDHLVDYPSVEEVTPFISTTAGTVERDPANARNVFFPPMYTALRFATQDFRQDGYVFYAYLFLLGRKSIELEEFGEEIRDLNLYSGYYPWHPEGEIVAKVHIPARRIEKAEKYDHVELEERLDRGEVPAPRQVFTGAGVYREPWEYANVRGFPEIP